MSATSTMLHRLLSAASRSTSAASHTARRALATRRRLIDKPLAPEVLEALPYEDVETPYPEQTDPELKKAATYAFPNRPVTSAHAIDLEKQEPSLLDSVAIGPGGKIVHGRFGELGAAAAAVPLEYLALLAPAAEGAAALRVLASKSKKKQGSTLLVYGATQANGFAAAQLANAAGHAVVAVVDQNHSGNDLIVECVKGMMNEPGTAVPEEYALSKKLFSNLVDSVSKGDEDIATPSPEEYVEEFKKLFVAYSEAYPDTRPAAVSAEELEFIYMEKEREFFEENMAAYLEQYPRGAPPVDQAKLDAIFSKEQYEIFRQKFWKQTSDVISGDDKPFEPPLIVQDMLAEPKTLEHKTYPGAGAEFPYSFSILNQFFPQGTEMPKGGPIMGALICVTPQLKKAAEMVAAAKTKREKGEVLHFLTPNEKSALNSARSVAAQAEKVGAPVVVCGGSLPGLETVKTTDADVKEALQAMDIDEEGNSRLNYFIQAYRANNFSFYGDYAVHRASEPLAGPRQIIVTK